MDKVLEGLMFLGFSEEEAKAQIMRLNAVIEAKIAEQIQSDSPQEKVLEVAQEVSPAILGEYFRAVTQNTTPIKRQKFYEIVEF